MQVALVSAQDIQTFKGFVKDINGKPVSGLTVSVVDEFTQSTTNPDGSFAIASQEGKKLLFSGKGYESTEWKLNSDNPVQVTIKFATEEKMYNVAYGVRSKTELTSSISTVTGEELAKSPVAVLSDAVQGTVTGLTALRNSGSEPGWTNTQFYVRGIGTFGSGKAPLYMVDNVVRDITQLDPEEIESLVVLKDAAATVSYGMNGANGVINVTTKRGFIGKPEISLKAQFGMQEATRLPQYLGSYDYVRFRNIALTNDGQSIPTDPRYNPDMYNGSQDPFLYANTDWYGEFLKKTAPQQIYKLSIAGGTDIVRYYVLLGVTDQRGFYNFGNENPGFSTNYDYTRYNVRSNVDVDLSKYLTVSLNLAGRLETKQAPATGSGNIFTALSKFPSIIPVKNRDGSIAGTSVYTNNPYGLIAKTGYGNYFYRYLQGNVLANQRLDFWVKGLSLNAMFAFDSYKDYTRGKNQQFAVYQENLDNTYSKFGEDTELGTGFSNWSGNYWLLSTFYGGISYDNQFGKKHHIAADVKYMQSLESVQGNNPDYKNQRVFGRLTYGFDKRYVVEFGWAYSGSEDFINPQRYQFFPVGSAAWVVSNEEFLKNNTIVNFLKLRGSYGLVGNSTIGVGRFPYQPNYFGGGGYTFGSGYAGSDGSYEGQLNNPDIGCEKSLNANIGLDVEFFKERLGLTADVFRNDRKDIVTTRYNTLPAIIGQSLPYQNLGSVLNKGIEISLTHKNRIGNFGYYAQANASYATNKITYMEEVQGQEPWLYSTGRSVNQIWGLQSAGFFNNQGEIDQWAKSTFGVVKPGDIKYVDQNKDGVINDNDLIPIGKPTIPEWNFGLTLGCDFKQFDFHILFTGITNRSLFVVNNVLFGMQDDSKITATAYDTWQQGVNESTALYPRLTMETSNHNVRNNDIWLQNGEYLRLQNVEMGYTLPKHWLAKAYIKELRVFANGFNLISFDHLKKFNLSAEYPNAGVTAYPETRIYNVGVSIKF
jgi:TonB-linked SusC/RagA family outer membrane protein